MSKMKKVLSIMLAFVMVLSLCLPRPLTAYAADGITLTEIPANNKAPQSTYVYGEKATIKGTTVKIYEDLYHGAPGVEITVAEGTEIDLITEYEFSNGAVIYRFDYWGSESPELYDAVLDYCFISAASLAGGEEPAPQPTPEPTPVPTPTPEPVEPEISIVNYGSQDFTAEITADTLTMFNTNIGDEATAVTGAAGEKVHVYFYYELSDGTTRYKVEYTGGNAALSTAIGTGYEFVKSTDVTEVAQPTPTPEPTPEPEQDAIVNFGSIDKNLTIADRTIKVYRNHIDTLDSKTVSNVKGEKVHAYFYYELADGTVIYKVEYTGRKTGLKSAIASGYEFVNAENLSTPKTKTSSWTTGWNF